MERKALIVLRFSYVCKMLSPLLLIELLIEIYGEENSFCKDSPYVLIKGYTLQSKSVVLERDLKSKRKQNVLDVVTGTSTSFTEQIRLCGQLSDVDFTCQNLKDQDWNLTVLWPGYWPKYQHIIPFSKLSGRQLSREGGWDACIWSVYTFQSTGSQVLMIYL